MTGVPLFLFVFLVSSWEMDGKAEHWWLGICRVMTNIIIALRTNALRAYEEKSSELIPPGPRSRVGTIQLNWVSSAYCPNVTYLLFGGRKALCSCCWYGTPAESNGDSTAAGGEGAQGAGGVHPASWGIKRGGGRVGGRLKPDVKVTIVGDRPPGLGGDVATFEGMREFLVAHLEYEQQMHVANEDGGDSVLARCELVDSATQMMFADEFYDGKPWIDLSEEELKKGLETFAGVDVQQTSDCLLYTSPSPRD